MKTFPLETLRLLVRLYRSEDLADYRGWRNHPQVVEALRTSTVDQERAAGYLATQAGLTEGKRKQWHAYAVVHRDTSRVIGEVGFFLQDVPDDEGDLGFAFHPDFQGKGYASEAANALLEYGFERLGLRRITGHCGEENAASYGLLERLGMRRYTDEKRGYALTREDWARR